MEKQLEDTMLMGCLMIPTTWNDVAVSAEYKKIPVEETMVDIFRSHKTTKEQIAVYDDLV